MKSLPLEAEHEALGAKLQPFAGYRMPIFYEGVLAEHKAVRERAGLFDVTHMGRYEVTGEGAAEMIQRLLTNNVCPDKPVVRYSLMCNEQGGIIEDLLSYHFRPDHFLLVVNAINAKGDLEWLTDHSPAGVTVRDMSEELAMLALQGPTAEAILAPLCDRDLTTLNRFHFGLGQLGGIATLISRSGYTGEDGFELIVPTDLIGELFDLLLAAGEQQGLALCGLGARDSLRLEAGLPLYGHELTTDLTPVEADLMRFVKLDKPGGVIGGEAIAKRLEEGPRYLRRGLIGLGRRVPRQGAELSLGGLPVGYVTSGAFSPIMERPIAQGYLRPEAAAVGMKIEFWVKDNPEAALVTGFPLHKPPD